MSAAFAAPLPKDAANSHTEKPARSRKAQRVQLDFQSRSMERLNALKEKTEAASYTEVIKNALRLYEAMVEDHERGCEFLIKDSEGTISPYRVFVA